MKKTFLEDKSGPSEHQRRPNESTRSHVKSKGHEEDKSTKAVLEEDLEEYKYEFVQFILTSYLHCIFSTSLVHGYVLALEIGVSTWRRITHVHEGTIIALGFLKKEQALC